MAALVRWLECLFVSIARSSRKGNELREGTGLRTSEPDRLIRPVYDYSEHNPQSKQVVEPEQ